MFLLPPLSSPPFPFPFICSKTTLSSPPFPFLYVCSKFTFKSATVRDRDADFASRLLHFGLTPSQLVAVSRPPFTTPKLQSTAVHRPRTPTCHRRQPTHQPSTTNLRLRHKGPENGLNKYCSKCSAL
nr:hypothetical protein Iba_chr15bCG9470 [Ipomoea batatas]GME00992.1 hypothetical protein Iba_contig719CG0010 [Ipomoea batatas]